MATRHKHIPQEQLQRLRAVHKGPLFLRTDSQWASQLISCVLSIRPLDSGFPNTLASGTEVLLTGPFFLPNPGLLRMSPSEFSQRSGFCMGK